MTTTRPVPTPSSWSEPFWAAAREERLTFQVCGSCGTATMYPKRLCPTCLSDALTWQDAAGTGEVYTWTEQVAGPPSGFEDRVPYVVAVVRLDEGVQLMSNIVGPDAANVQCGARVTVAFETVPGTDVVLPVFTLDEAPAGA
ncbi:Zn-ribbon domain-containing OB-fold protein [Nocardioides flavescens]|uniref:Zn-ribbon domain-containing OB-fold protein n=1 Tax=Nocardioides flavescens TaxID=2691959 RepID=A0A6L7ETQ4_9ACTN|nr:Zn-ribbon domain-containing OB-fold protein [Nocardioides flavescens]MXG89016.1 hypothetical protein [Nocardioides flavescens]